MDQVAEEEFKARVRQLCYDAMYELRETIKPNFNAADMGYTSPDHARLTIVKLADKQITRMAEEHLKAQRK